MKKIFFILLLLLLLYFISFPIFTDELLTGNTDVQSKDIDILLITLVIGLFIIIIFVTIVIIVLTKILKGQKKDVIVLKGLNMEERRKDLRDIIPSQIMVKQQLPDGGYKLMAFKNRNVSKGGVFIITENLSLFDLGQELEIKIKDGNKYHYEGKAVVIHTEAIFNKDSIKTESGYGVMFLMSP